MSVRKFRSVDEMPARTPLEPLEPENLRIAFELMELARRLGPLHFVPGVRKHQTYEELLVSRGAEETEQARAARNDPPRDRA
jgi:hypothetical protein